MVADRTKQAGIGTDATMHDHIKKLLDRCYATKDANTRFCPTTLVSSLPAGVKISRIKLIHVVIVLHRLKKD